MKLSKRIFAAVAAAAVMAPLAAGCGNNGNNGSTPSSSGNSSSNNSSSASSDSGNANNGEKAKISLALWVGAATEENNGAEERFNERMPNVELDIMPFERATWTDQINTRVAGGDIPDIIYRDSQGLVAQYAEQGVICEVPIEKCAQYAPNIYESTKSYGTEVWLACNVNGTNYGLPIMQPGVIAPFSNHWRMDYLEKVNVTEIPTTIEEAEEVFLKIIAADVNGSGAAGDTYGLTFRGKDATSRLFESIFMAYGVNPAKWMLNDDNTLTFGWMRDEIKDGLTLLNRWYELGIIDPEFVTTDGAIFNQKVASGSIAYYTAATWNRAQPPQGEFYLNAISGDPNAELVVGPALKGPNGDYGYNTWGSVTSAMTFGSHLAKDEEKLNLCLQVVDFISADTEDNVYIRYGVEGTDWERNDVGAWVTLHTDANDAAKFGTAAWGGIAPVPEFAARQARTDDAEYSKYAREGTVQPGESYIDWCGFFTDGEKTSATADVDPDFYAGIIDIITGVRPVSDYDILRQAWYDGGGQAATDEYNRAYKEGGAVMDEILAQIK